MSLKFNDIWYPIQYSEIREILTKANLPINRNWKANVSTLVKYLNENHYDGDIKKVDIMNFIQNKNDYDARNNEDKYFEEKNHFEEEDNDEINNLRQEIEELNNQKAKQYKHIEHLKQIIKSNNAYIDVLENEIKENTKKSTLKLISTFDISKLKKVKEIDSDNDEVYDYIKKYHLFHSKSKTMILLKEPENREAFDICYNANESDRKYKSEEIVKNKPAVLYYKNHDISNIDDIIDYLKHIFENEVKPFKLQFNVGGIYESIDSSNDEPVYKYEYSHPNYNLANRSIPVIMRTKADIDLWRIYFNEFLYTLQEFSFEKSNTKLCAITSIVFSVGRMIKVNGKIELPEEIVKSKSIITDNIDDQLCWYRFLITCLGTESQNKDSTKRTIAAKKLCAQDHNIKYTTTLTNEAKQFLDNFEGMDIDKMKISAEKHKININFYDYDAENKIYDISEQWFFNKDWNTYSALLISKNGIIHIMRITNPEALTSIMICPICKSYCHRKSSKHNKRFENHVKKCDGKFRKEIVLDKVSKPYCPHILNNPTLEYCLAYKLQWKPTQYYATFDFETMEKPECEITTRVSFLNSRLIPITVSSAIKSKNGINVKHFDIRQNGSTESCDIRTDNFIYKWLEWLFDSAEDVINDNFQDLLNIGIPEEKALELENKTMTIFGFNSARFDTNLFKQYFNTDSWNVQNEGLIGSATSFKQIILKHKTKEIKLRFIDAQAFTAGGTLKQFGIDFGGETNTEKGVFPYEAINTNNYNEVLNKSEPFKYSDFYSYLNQKNPLTMTQYNDYVEDSKNYNNRWEYLLKYNDKDVEMMIKPIDELIRLNAKYQIDLIKNLSLSKNSSCIKYAMSYCDFDFETDYDIKIEKTTFKPTEQWWQHKCDSYYQQDEKYNINKKNKKKRNLDKCVNYDDYNWICNLLTEDSKCYICGEHFDYSNKPTLDRIDNDIGHEKTNVKLCCSICNVLRNRNDDKITRLRVQLKKYCLFKNLPMTITDEHEYTDLRNNITGGLSNVMHRVNLKGITRINKLRYKDGKVISQDTNNIMTHVVGVDFNSLYPSAFSSNQHSFNPYHNHKMYMPGRLICRLDAKNNYQKCLNIINSETRFYGNPKFIFWANVKLKMPEHKIDDFINFPPIFRHHNVKTDEKTIGSYMYNYMRTNHLPTDVNESKLTMLLDTGDEYECFSCYYLWFLIDHGLEIVDIKSVSIYSAHDSFNMFVNEFMSERRKILSGETNGSEKFYKISMNGSYGYDGMNTEKFNKVKFCSKDQTYREILSDTYMDAREINEDLYIVQMNNKRVNCNTCLQEAFWTLDNAKFWYLTFIYDFMKKCLDMNKIHFIEGDTDSMYWAIAGNPNESNTQAFKYVVRNRKFYNRHIYKFMPNPNKGLDDEKKILGLAIEKQGDNMIALAPKCYTIWSDNKCISLKLKGVSLKKNNIKSEDYRNVIENNITVKGYNINLQMKDGIMSKITIVKNALTAAHTKMIVLENQCCCPFVKGLDAKDYIIQ